MINSWGMLKNINEWLDDETGIEYHDQPLAQDWARVSKIGEELGEAISELILWTEQNPRKPYDPEAYVRLRDELADVIITAMLALQHFTKDIAITQNIIADKIKTIHHRVGLDS
jgi:hypothetical protein